MRVLRIRSVRRSLRLKNSVVAVGVFDGVHAAHRAIIAAAVRYARRNRTLCVVLTFWPHPRGEQSLYSLTHRLRIIEELGVDVCVVVTFTRGFAALSPLGFVNTILARQLGACKVFVGENFRFGKNAAGDAALLTLLAKSAGIGVTVFSRIMIAGRVVSSSLLRRLITAGKLEAARRMLLRPVSVFGNVVRGSGRGKALGYPTANIDPHHEVTPPAGIYAVMVVLGRARYQGLCYIGTRSTFAAQKNKGRRTKKTKKRAPLCCIEVHMLGFTKNIYGKTLEVQFIKKIRGDKKFFSAEALIRQIKKDIQKALPLFPAP